MDDDDEEEVAAVVIKEEEDYEFLCEIEYENGRAVPMPIEEKFICKTEPEQIQEMSSCMDMEMNNSVDVEMIAEEFGDDVLNLDDQVACAMRGSNNNYIAYVCPQCGAPFMNAQQWKRHIEQLHNLNDQHSLDFTQKPNNRFECNKCQTMITRCTLKTLQHHRFTHLPYKVYKCKMCPLEASSLYAMLSHIMMHKDMEEQEEGMNSSKANLTSTIFNKISQTSLELECSLWISYRCPVCGQTFDDEESWQAHINFRYVVALLTESILGLFFAIRFDKQVKI